MADIRQNPGFLDDFDRADENPLSGGGNWAQTASGFWSELELENNQATLQGANTLSSSYWTPTSYSGDDCEVWGIAAGGGASGMAFRLGLYKDVGVGANLDGYRYGFDIGASGGRHVIRELLNGAGSNLAVSADAGGTPTGNPGHLLFRRNGNDLEGWWSSDAGANWTLMVSATDTTYTTNLFLSLDLADNGGLQSVEWTAFGGGPAEEFFPQIYRRPFG